ncbi:MAG TPA: hypothetical protein VHA37_01250, partial [Candidatus Saccharimonadales bacterium]|nr:hypothetical protein [Candidatus Saccharimonadales bacterium]
MDTLGTSFDLALSNFPTAYDAAASVFSGKPVTAASDWWFSHMVDPMLRRQASLQLGPNASVSEKVAGALGDVSSLLAQVYLTGGAAEVVPAAETVPQLIRQTIEHGTKAMAFPAVSNAIDTGRKVYQETGDATQALHAATMEYATNTAQGFMPLSTPGGIIKRILTGGLSGAATGELSREAMNAVLPDGMQQPFDIDQLLTSAATGAALGGAFGPRTELNVNDLLRQQYDAAARAEKAEHAYNGIQAVGQLSAASKLRERAPEAFRQFVDDAVENGNVVSDVWIKADDLATALHQSGVDINQLQAKLPGVAAQLPEAVQTHGDIRIPVADYATHIAGGVADNAILPHLKVEPDGMTYAESQVFRQEQQADLERRAQQIVTDKVADDAQQASRQGVIDDIARQAEATGRVTPEVAKAYATLHGDFFTTLAAKLGISPEEAYRQHGAKIVAEQIDGFTQENAKTVGEFLERARRQHRGSEATNKEQYRQALAEVLGREPTEQELSGEVQTKGELRQTPKGGKGGESLAPRGTYNPETRTIALLKHADLSTFLHESGHFFLDTYSRIAAQPDAPAAIKADMDALLKWFGVQPSPEASALDHWNAMSLDEQRPFHEQLARSFERYLLEG